MGLGGDGACARQRAIAGALVAAVALLATNACSDATQVTVILRTNVPFAQGSSVALWASHSGRVTEPMGTWADPWLADGEIGDLVVTPQAGKRDGAVSLRVALGLGGKPASSCTDSTPDRCIIARRKLAFVPKTRLRVPIVMYLACEGVVCDPDSTCNHLGACVSATVDPSACATPEGCSLPGEPKFDPTPTARDAGADTGAVVDADAADTGFTSSGGIAQLAIGGATTCARRTDGRVQCWGSSGLFATGAPTVFPTLGDAPGQMGDALPVIPLPGGRTAVQMAMNQGAVCAVLDTGDVHCVGPNALGWLGRNAGASIVADLGTGIKASQVAMGENHVCALTTTGRVKCWGPGGVAGLGDQSVRGDDPGEMGDALPFVDLGPGFTAAELTVGANFTCARTTDGRVKCWGANENGQLGLGDSIFRGGVPGQMGNALPLVDLGTGLTALSVRAGSGHVCAIVSNNTLKCWGANNGLNLGLGDAEARGDNPGEMGDALPAVALGAGQVPVKVSPGVDRTCVQLQSGAVKCWGAGGNIGAGDAQSRGSSAAHMGDNLPAVDLGPGETATDLSQGTGRAVCALLAAGGLKCWGNDGALGLGGDTVRGDGPLQMGVNLPRVNLGTGASVVEARTAGQTSCARLSTGQIKCWGFVRTPESRRGDRPGTMGSALPAIDLGTGLVSSEIAINSSHACAIVNGGAVKCWGVSLGGLLGLGDTLDRGNAPGQMGDALPAVPLGTGAIATQLAAGLRSTCARLADGRIKCWGPNGSGELGLGDTLPRGSAPGQMGDALPAVDLGSNAVATQVSGVNSHYCARLTNGTVKCWGDNSFGQLGVGDTLSRGAAPNTMGDNLPPMVLDGALSVASVGAGFGTSCVLYTNGDVACTDSAAKDGKVVRVDLGTGAIAKALSVGTGHQCALLTSGQVKCWGGNIEGYLGLGDTVLRSPSAGGMGDALPPVALGSNWTTAQVLAGGQITCAVSTDGRGKCWGRNDFGQLGLGDALRRGAAPNTMGDTLPAIQLQ